MLGTGEGTWDAKSCGAELKLDINLTLTKSVVLAESLLEMLLFHQGARDWGICLGQPEWEPASLRKQVAMYWARGPTLGNQVGMSPTFTQDLFLSNNGYKYQHPGLI